jgi:hypothetical protein
MVQAAGQLYPSTGPRLGADSKTRRAKREVDRGRLGVDLVDVCRAGHYASQCWGHARCYRHTAHHHRTTTAFVTVSVPRRSGQHTIAELAELFSVSRPTVYRVLERAPWHQHQLVGRQRYVVRPIPYHNCDRPLSFTWCPGDAVPAKLTHSLPVSAGAPAVMNAFSGCVPAGFGPGCGRGAGALGCGHDGSRPARPRPQPGHRSAKRRGRPPA